MKYNYWIVLFFTLSHILWAQSAATQSQPYNGLVRSLLVTKTYLFAGTKNGILRSSDNGNTWSRVNSGFYNTDIIALAESKGYLFASTWGGGVYRSSDNGDTWQQSNFGFSTPTVLWFYSMENILFAGTFENAYCTTDLGENWAIASLEPAGKYISAMVHANTLFTATRYGIYRSTDNGKSAQLQLSDVNVNTLAIAGNSILAGTTGQSLYRSLDDGITWQPITQGLTCINILTLKTHGKYLFAGTLSCGIYRSADNGATWQAVNTGLVLNDFHVLGFSVNGTSIFAATNQGIFRSVNNGTTWVKI